MKMQRPEMNIALITAGLDEDYQISLWKTLVRASKERNINLVTLPSLAVFETTLQAIKTEFLKKRLQTGWFHGIIFLTSSLTPHVTVREMRDIFSAVPHVPVVSLGKHLSGIHSILIDNAQGMKELTEHLLKNHHPRKILFLSGPEGHSEVKERKTSFLKVLKACGRQCKLKVITGTFVDSAVEPLLEAARQENGGCWDFDLLVASNDVTAIESIRLLARWNVVVPEQTAVTGFDDIPASACFLPGLTTVHQPLSRLSETALDTVTALIRGESPPYLQLLPGYMVVRESCGCAKGSALTIENKSLGKKFSGQDNEHILLRDLLGRVPDIPEEREKSLIMRIKKRILGGEPIEQWFNYFKELSDDTGLMASQMNWLTSLKTNLDLFNLSRFEYPKIEVERIYRRLRAMSVELLTAFEKEDIHRILDQGLERINAGRFRIIVFGPAGETIPFYSWPPESGNKEDALRNSKQDEDEYPFPCVISPLFFKDEIMGYLILEAGLTCIPLYIQLSRLLANTLKVSRLYQERAQYTQKLEHEVAARTASLSEEVRYRKMAEKQAVEKEKKVRQILDAMPVPVLICRLNDSRILYANPSYRQIMGTSGRIGRR
jgi:DNA-binding LacI/PurR family transcriptional regulator/PAS domain-containing protein